MAQEVYVNCEGRSVHRAVEALRRDVGALRPGASIVVVRTRNDEALEAIVRWASLNGLSAEPAVRSTADGKVELRFFVLPSRFGALPDCTCRELRRARGTRTPVGDGPELYAV